MIEQVCGVVVHPIRPRALQLLGAIAAGQEPDAEHARAARRACPRRCRRPDRIDHIDPELAHGLEEQIGVGFGVGHEITGDDRHAVGQASSSSAGPAVAIRPLVAIAKGSRACEPRSRARAPGSARTSPMRRRYASVSILQAHEQGLVQRAPGLAQQRA